MAIPNRSEIQKSASDLSYTQDFVEKVTELFGYNEQYLRNYGIVKISKDELIDVGLSINDGEDIADYLRQHDYYVIHGRFPPTLTGQHRHSYSEWRLIVSLSAIIDPTC
jgi:hypothetical protein